MCVCEKTYKFVCFRAVSFLLWYAYLYDMMIMNDDDNDTCRLLCGSVEVLLLLRGEGLIVNIYGMGIESNGMESE